MELSAANGHTNIDSLFISAVCFPVVRSGPSFSTPPNTL